MRKYRFMVTLLILIAVLISWGNGRLTVRNVLLTSDHFPAALDQLRIVHLSDLHFKSLNRVTASLVARIPDLNPDLIFFTGDLVDAKTENFIDLIVLLQTLRRTAPVICVPGNHEYWSDLHPEIGKELEKINVAYLCNEAISFGTGENEILILGLDDPASGRFHESMLYLNESANQQIFTILMAHRPEFFLDYCLPGIGLVCSGHAHGGQFRFPGIGGLIAPDQGLFPPYTEGPYYHNDSVMVVSRGLGNSIIPFRFLNPPEIILIEIKRNPRN